MAHKTLINGTAYEIDGGKTLVNGTAYEVDKGKTLVGGTMYGVEFAPSEVTLTITAQDKSSGSGSYKDYATVTVNGTTYQTTTTGTLATLVVPYGTVVRCSAKGSASTIFSGAINLNGTTIQTTEQAGNTVITYDHTLTKDTDVELKVQYYSYMMSSVRAGTVTITEK